jgi:hypothetical protein
MIERQQVDHRTKAQLSGPLGDRREKHARRRRIAEGSHVVLGNMVAVEAGTIVGLDQLEPLLEQLAERDAAIIQMIKNPKAHAAFLRMTVDALRCHIAASVL